MLDRSGRRTLRMVPLEKWSGQKSMLLCRKDLLQPMDTGRERASTGSESSPRAMLSIHSTVSLPNSLSSSALLTLHETIKGKNPLQYSDILPQRQRKSQAHINAYFSEEFEILHMNNKKGTRKPNSLGASKAL